jgi:GAF domain-containing protein
MLSSIYTRAFEKAVEMSEKGRDQKEILAFLATAAQSASGPDTATSILLLDDNGLLRNGASPLLPPDYLEAIDGIKPNENVGTCASAAATGNVVFTPDFYADNKWGELRHLPTALGFIGAWSMPIKQNNQVIGTFGTYFRKYRQPSADEIKGVELLASAVAKAVTSPIHN